LKPANSKTHFISPPPSQLPHPTFHNIMSDNERPRDRYRERDSRREPREDRNREGGTPSDRRNRSRSPRRERGGRRDNPRHRSRSPLRGDGRDKDGAREQRGRGRGDRDRDQDRDRRDAPRGPRGGASPPREPRGGPVKAPPVVKKEETPDVEMKDDAQKPEDMDDETWEMKKMMGFAGFKSTKNQKVPGNDKNFGVRKDKQMEARQYMNRQGGFNRPLSPSRG
jgi:U4/U6.U5 tri-snRNP-associated protein 3